MRDDAEHFLVESAPPTGVTVAKLQKIDGTVKLVLPRPRFDLVILIVDLNEGAGTDHRVERIVVQPDESIEIFSDAKMLHESDRDFTPGLDHAGQEIRLLNPRARIEPHRKTDSAFRVVDLGGNEMSLGQLDCEASCVDLVQIDAKEQEEVHEINPIECAECEQLVDTRDPVGVLDLDQRAVGHTISLVPLRMCD